MVQAVLLQALAALVTAVVALLLEVAIAVLATMQLPPLLEQLRPSKHVPRAPHAPRASVWAADQGSFHPQHAI
jgi:hypothetical protein